ncbi:MAG: 16S rRNA (cytidine(1402)-2'-O)-methyltransferase [Leptospirales bacterium]
MSEKNQTTSPDSGILYSVAVPIGNIDDITRRAEKILGSVDVIACEHTQKFRDLANRASIKTNAKVLAYHSYNEAESAKGLVKLLEEGKNLALVSDAGTPRISDPGFHLFRLAHEKNIKIVPVPGVSALTAIASVAPIPLEPLLFLGFITPKPGKRINLLKKYLDFQGTICFYESVHRIEKLILSFLEVWGNKEIFIARELTKQYEEFFSGTVEEAVSWIKGKKGEFVILVRKND